MTYVPDIAAMERELIAKLEAGGGTVDAEFWQPFLRVVIDDDQAVDRLEQAATTWRRAHGMPDGNFIVGEAD